MHEVNNRMRTGIYGRDRYIPSRWRADRRIKQTALIPAWNTHTLVCPGKTNNHQGHRKGYGIKDCWLKRERNNDSNDFISQCKITIPNVIFIIPEQFTVKAHPAYLKGRGEGWAKKWGTVIPVYSWHTLSKRAQNIIPFYIDIHFQNALKTQKLRRLVFCYIC